MAHPREFFVATIFFGFRVPMAMAAGAMAAMDSHLLSEYNYK